jgi:DNA-binding CsgD family transcriptional regulator
MDLKYKDYKHVLQVINTAYAIQARETMFPQVFSELCKLVPVGGALFFRHDAWTQRILFRSHLLYNVELADFLLLKERGIRAHPLYRQMHAGSGGRGPMCERNRVWSLEEIAGHAEARHHSREYSELRSLWGLGSHEMWGVLGFRDKTIGHIGIFREEEQGPFSEREKKIVNMVLQHIACSLYMRDILEDKYPNWDYGLIYLDADNTVTGMNDEARKALNGASPEAILSSATRKEKLFHNGLYSYKVNEIELQTEDAARLLVFAPLTNWLPIIGNIRRFNLTKREEEISILTINGYSNKEIASQLYISEQTVKEHISNIFQKLRVRKKIELVTKLLGSN